MNPTAAIPSEAKAPARSDREELWALVIMAAPLVLGQVGWSLMGFVDTVILGQVGKDELAGGGLGSSTFFVFTVPGIGILMGFDPLISQAIGARDPARARAWMWQAFYLSIATSAVVALAMLALRENLGRFGMGVGVERQAADFILWRLPSLPFLLFFVVGRSYLQAVNKARVVGVAAIVCNVLNFAGDYLLVHGGAALPEWAGPLRSVPQMGAAGAAATSSVCTAAQFAMVAWALWRERITGARPPRPSLEAWKTGLKVGVPIGLQLAAEVGAFVVVAFLAARFNAANAGAHQVAISFASMTFNVAMGIANAGSVRVGWAVGAKNPEAVQRSGRVAFLAGGGFMSLSAALFVLVPGQLISLFGLDPEVVVVAVPLMRVAGVFQIVDGLQVVGAGVLRGAGDTVFASVVNLIGYYTLGLPVSIWLAFWARMNVTGLWIGLCLGLFVVAACLVWRFRVVAGRPIQSVA